MDKTTTVSRTILFPWELTFSVLALTIPFLVSGSQLLVGTLVNSFLFIFVARSSKKTLPIIIFPSIGALMRGVIFGPLTPFLLYFLPFIWIGNYLLVKTFEKLLEKTNFFNSIFISAGVKSVFLYFMALIFFKLNIVPNLFLKTMGLIQFITAILGGFIAIIIIKLFNNYDRT